MYTQEVAAAALVLGAVRWSELGLIVASGRLCTLLTAHILARAAVAALAPRAPNDGGSVTPPP